MDANAYDSLSAAWQRAQADDAQDEAMDAELLEPQELADTMIALFDQFVEDWQESDAHFEDEN